MYFFCCCRHPLTTDSRSQPQIYCWFFCVDLKAPLPPMDQTTTKLVYSCVLCECALTSTIQLTWLACKKSGHLPAQPSSIIHSPQGIKSLFHPPPPTVIQFLIVAFCFHGMMYYDISLSTYIWSMKWIAPKSRLIWIPHRYMILKHHTMPVPFIIL